MQYDSLIACGKDNLRLCHWLNKNYPGPGVYTSRAIMTDTEKGRCALVFTEIYASPEMAAKISAYVRRFAPLARYAINY